MTKFNVEAVIEAWTDPLQPLLEEPEKGGVIFRLQDAALKLLAQGEPVAAERLAAMTGVPVEQVQEMFRLFAEAGGGV